VKGGVALRRVRCLRWRWLSREDEDDNIVTVDGSVLGIHAAAAPAASDTTDGSRAARNKIRLSAGVVVVVVIFLLVVDDPLLVVALFTIVRRVVASSTNQSKIAVPGRRRGTLLLDSRRDSGEATLLVRGSYPKSHSRKNWARIILARVMVTAKRTEGRKRRRLSGHPSERSENPEVTETAADGGSRSYCRKGRTQRVCPRPCCAAPLVQ